MLIFVDVLAARLSGYGRWDDMRAKGEERGVSDGQKSL